MPTPKRTTEFDPCQAWRANVKKALVEGDKLEAFAKRTGLTFCEVNPYSGELAYYSAGWEKPEEDATSLVTFRRMVERVVRCIGPADEVRASGYSTAHPDLIATWSLNEARVRVTMISPAGCKLKPGTEPQERTPEPADTVKPELHPECIAALKEIEDLS